MSLIDYNAKILEIIRDEPCFKKTNNELEVLHYFRYVTFKRLRILINSGVIDTFEIVSNPDNFIAIMNALHTYDLSLAIKTGVNFGLFGAGLLRLGAPHQVEQLVTKLNRGEIFGCLAITEIGHGSNLKGLETQAHWNSDVNHFILNSPTETSTKCWIGNALHATHAIVFAQLIYKGSSKGIHPFIVQIRDNKSRYFELCSGVKIMDNGPKKGLNGVDNGTIHFSNMYLDRDALLSNFGYINDRLEYTLKDCHKKESVRFSELLSTLSGGRGVLASGSNVVGARACLIACQFGMTKKQFGEPERPILSYMTHILKLGSLIAKSVVLSKAFQTFQGFGTEEFKRSGTVSKKLHILTSMFKIACSEHAERCCRESRLLCGGHGYGMNNEICKMHNDIDIYQTFEGDNTLLRQEICKYKLGCLGDYVSESNFYRILYAMRMKIAKKLRSEFVNYDNKESVLSQMKFRERFRMLQLVEKMAVEVNNNDYFSIWCNSLDGVMEVANLFIVRKVYELFIKNFSLVQYNQQYNQQYLKECLKLYAINEMGEQRKYEDVVRSICKNICQNYERIRDLIGMGETDIIVPIIKKLSL